MPYQFVFFCRHLLYFCHFSLSSIVWMSLYFVLVIFFSSLANTFAWQMRDIYLRSVFVTTEDLFTECVAKIPKQRAGNETTERTGEEKKTPKDWWHKLILHIRWIRMRWAFDANSTSSRAKYHSAHENFLFYSYIELWSALVVLKMWRRSRYSHVARQCQAGEQRSFGFWQNCECIAEKEGTICIHLFE